MVRAAPPPTSRPFWAAASKRTLAMAPPGNVDKGGKISRAALALKVPDHGDSDDDSLGLDVGADDTLINRGAEGLLHGSNQQAPSRNGTESCGVGDNASVSKVLTPGELSTDGRQDSTS